MEIRAGVTSTIEWVCGMTVRKSAMIESLA